VSAWSGLSRRDKQMLTISISCVALLIVAIAIFGPPREDDGVPSSYSNTPHGARAAFLLLQRSGYRVDRSVNPLGQVAPTATPQTTFIFADPFYGQIEDARAAVKEILDRGGRVVVTGFSGSLLLPGSNLARAQISPYTCTASPRGLSDLAGSGEIRIRAEAVWRETHPVDDVAYRCDAQAVVVSFPSGKGTVVWWASASPLENGAIDKSGNLALLLNSIGPRESTRVLWDESLHGATPSIWSYTAGTVLPYVWWQAALVALLLLFSFSRRNGPLRPDPVVQRATPLEFVHSLGAVYHQAGAANAAVAAAWQAFRLRLERAAGVSLQATAIEAFHAMERRYPTAAPGLRQIFEAASQAAAGPAMSAKSALVLVNALHAAEQRLI